MTEPALKGQDPDRPYSLELAIYQNASDDTQQLIRQQLDRRHEMSKRDSTFLLMGLWFGLIVTLVFVAASVYLVSSGHDVAGTVLGTVDLVALVAIFVLRHKQ